MTFGTLSFNSNITANASVNVMTDFEAYNADETEPEILHNGSEQSSEETMTKLPMNFEGMTVSEIKQSVKNHFSKDELGVLESYMTMNVGVGAVGFGEDYNDYPSEITKVIIILKTLPTEILPMVEALRGESVSANEAENRVNNSHDKFMSEMSNNGISNQINITREYKTLLNGYAAEIPAGLIDNIASSGSVYMIQPDYEIYADSIPDSASVLNSSANTQSYGPQWTKGTDPYSDFIGLGMKASRELLKIGYINDSLGITGKGIKVGVLDTGIDYNHPDLKDIYNKDFNGNTVDESYDFVNDDNDPMETTYADWQEEYAKSGAEMRTATGYYWTSHGTHVSGTIAAQGKGSGANSALGMAPDVVLRVYKVLGPYGGGSSSSQIAACEKAYQVGCDVINLSLGAAYNDPNYAGCMVLNNAVLRGIIVCATSGNSGNPMTGYAYASVGVPGQATLAITVGAGQAGGYTYGKMDYKQAKVNNNAGEQVGAAYDARVTAYDADVYSFENDRIVGSLGTDNPEPVYIEGKGYELVRGPGYGSTAEFNSALSKGEIYPGCYKGKIVVIPSGPSYPTVALAEKLRNAKQYGASAMIIASSNADHLTGISLAVGYIPVISINAASQIRLQAALDTAKAAGESVYLSPGDVSENKNPNELALFTSVGPVAKTWGIKPDIIAPGVAIVSTYPAFAANFNAADPDTPPSTTDYSKAYALSDGTSMACPHVTGIAALMSEKFRDASPAEIKARLMNNADTDFVSKYSVYQVGSGLIDPLKALTEEQFATVRDTIPNNGEDGLTGDQTLSSLNYGIVEIGVSESRTLEVTVNNTSNHSVTFTKSVEFVDPSLLAQKNNTFMNATANDIGFDFGLPSIIIPARSSVKFNTKILLGNSVQSGVYQGYLYLKNDKTLLKLPFAVYTTPAPVPTSIASTRLMREVINSNISYMQGPMSYMAPFFVTFNGDCNSIGVWGKKAGAPNDEGFLVAIYTINGGAKHGIPKLLQFYASEDSNGNKLDDGEYDYYAWAVGEYADPTDVYLGRISILNVTKAPAVEFDDLVASYEIGQTTCTITGKMEGFAYQKWEEAGKLLTTQLSISHPGTVYPVSLSNCGVYIYRNGGLVAVVPVDAEGRFSYTITGLNPNPGQADVKWNARGAEAGSRIYDFYNGEWCFATRTPAAQQANITVRQAKKSVPPFTVPVNNVVNDNIAVDVLSADYASALTSITLNGNTLTPGTGFTVNGTTVTVHGSAVNPIAYGVSLAFTATNYVNKSFNVNIVDANAPAVTADRTGSSSPSNNTSVRLSYTGSDSAALVCKYIVDTNAEAPALESDYINTASTVSGSAVVGDVTLSEGTYYIHCFVTDSEYIDESSLPIPVKVTFGPYTIDTTAPEIRIASPIHDKEYNPAYVPVITFSTTEKLLSGTGHAVIKVDGGTVYKASTAYGRAVYTAGSISIPISSFLLDGSGAALVYERGHNYTLALEQGAFTDRAGNETAADLGIVFRTSMAVIPHSIKTDPENVYGGTAFKVILEGNGLTEAYRDAITEVNFNNKTADIVKMTGSELAFIIPAEDNIMVYSAVPLRIKATGYDDFAATVNVRACSAPSAAISVSPNEIWVNAPIPMVLTFIPGANSVGLTSRKYEVNTRTTTANYTYTSSSNTANGVIGQEGFAGEYYVHYRIVDPYYDAGNPFNGKFGPYKVDCSVPVVEALTAAVTNVDEITLNVAASDTGSGIASYRWQMKDENDVWRDIAGAVTARYVLSGYSISDISLCRVIITDEVGNTATSDDVMPVTSLTLDKTWAVVGVNGSLALIPTVTPAKASAVKTTWESSDITIAEVDSNGVVTGISVGEAIIYAKMLSGTVVAQCVVSVTERGPIYATKVTVNTSALTNLKKGATVHVTATVEPGDVSYPGVVWTSSNPRVATVDELGNIKGIAAGTVVITVTTADGKAKCIFTVKVTN